MDIISRTVADSAVRQWFVDSKIRERFDVRRFTSPDNKIDAGAVAACGGGSPDAPFALYAVGRARQHAARAGTLSPFPEFGQIAEWWYLVAGVLPAILYARVDFHRLLSHTLTFEEIVLLAQRRVPGGRERDLECILDRRKPPPLTLGMRRWLGMASVRAPSSTYANLPSPGTPSGCGATDRSVHFVEGIVVPVAQPVARPVAARPPLAHEAPIPGGSAGFEDAGSAGFEDTDSAGVEGAEGAVAALPRAEVRESAAAAADRIQLIAEDDESHDLDWFAESDGYSTEDAGGDASAGPPKPKRTKRRHRVSADAALHSPYSEVFSALASRYRGRAVVQHGMWLFALQQYVDDLDGRSASDDAPNCDLERTIRENIAGNRRSVAEMRGVLMVVDRFPGILNCPTCLPFRVHNCVEKGLMHIPGYASALDKLRPENCSQETLDAAAQLRDDLLEAELRLAADPDTPKQPGYRRVRVLSGKCTIPVCSSKATHNTDGGHVTCFLHADMVCTQPKCLKTGKPYRWDESGREVVRNWCDDHVREGWTLKRNR